MSTPKAKTSEISLAAHPKELQINVDIGRHHGARARAKEVRPAARRAAPGRGAGSGAARRASCPPCRARTPPARAPRARAYSLEPKNSRTAAALAVFTMPSSSRSASASAASRSRAPSASPRAPMRGRTRTTHGSRPAMQMHCIKPTQIVRARTKLAIFVNLPGEMIGSPRRRHRSAWMPRTCAPATA